MVDLDAIEVYEAALENLPGYENDWAKLIGRLRWQCVKAAPKNEDASLQNLRKCLAKNDIENAQQVSNIFLIFLVPCHCQNVIIANRRVKKTNRSLASRLQIVWTKTFQQIVHTFSGQSLSRFYTL